MRASEPHPYELIAAAIRQKIASGEYQVDSRIPSARALAEEWGVARATADRAIQRLRDEGLIDIGHGRAGTVVSDPNRLRTLTIALGEETSLEVESVETTEASRATALELGVPEGTAVLVVRLRSKA